MFSFATSLIPSLPLLGLSEKERQTILTLEARALLHRQHMEISEAYYLGEQVIQNLRIAVPAELEFLRTIVGWPAIAVDPLVERLSVDGFRLPGATDADADLADLWDENGLSAEQSLAFTDALSMSRSYWAVGSPVETGGAPQITVESPLSTSVLWDLSGNEPRAALQEYWAENNTRRGALLLPNQTIHLATDDNRQWVISNRDQHGFDFVPIVRMANRPRTNNRDGRSEITLAMRAITDAACRTLLGLEVARELYSVPQKVLLGASESDFQAPDGTPKTGWSTYITKVLGLERDEEGNLPDLKQLQAYDPSVFTKLIDMYASQMAGQLAAPPQDLGLYTQGNPTSSEAAHVGESRRDRRAVLKQSMFGVPLVKVMQTALRFQNKGVLPDEFKRMSVDWHSVSMESMSLSSDALSKQVAAGMVSPTSDVVLKKAGYTAVERERLAADREQDGGQEILQQVAHSLVAKAARTDKAVTADLAPEPGVTPATPPSSGA